MFNKIQYKAVIYGFLVSVVLSFIVGGIFGVISGARDLVERSHIVSLQEKPSSTLLLILIIGLLPDIAGGFVTARKAKGFPKFNVLVLGALMVILGLFLLDPKIPLWFNLAGFLAVIPCTYLGGLIGLKRDEPRKRPSRKAKIFLIVLAVLAALSSCEYMGVSFYPIALKIQAKQGNAKAQYELGRLYQNGELLVTQKFDEAAKWYRMAAEQGDAEAQRALGNMYYMGLGVAQDYDEAVRWTEKSAKQRNARGEYAFGYLYAKGHGVQQDYVEAAKWYRASADQGNDGAQFELGVLFYNGLGVEKNYEEASRWWFKSAEAGNTAAASSLGYLYAKGLGVAQNYESAYFWLKAAPASNNFEYISTINLVASKLTPEQKASVEENVQKLKKVRGREK